MPHLVVEAARRAVERRLLATPIDLDGTPDILAPPLPIRITQVTPLGTIRGQILVEAVELQTVPGSAQSTLLLSFDEGSVEILGGGGGVGMLSGHVWIPFGLGFVAGPGPKGQAAVLNANFTGTNVNFRFDSVSKVKVAASLGGWLAGEVENVISAYLTTKFQALGAQSTGLAFDLTPGVPSEEMLTVEGLPGVVWVNGETLALSLRYAEEASPPPFQPVPFLPPGVDAAFGLRLSNDGFQRTVRNPAIRKMARDFLSARLIDGFIHDAYVARGGTGDITDGDKADGATRLDDYLKTPQGLTDLANETPSPVGGGKLRKRVTKVPDPFSDFDVEIPELDLWLGTNRIEGRAVAQGEVNGFGFTAHITFRATPALVQTPSLSIEMHDLQIDDPDLDIDLPPWLEWAFGILAGVIAGPVIGMVVGFLLSSVISSLAEAFVPSLSEYVPAPEGKPVTGLPAGVSLSTLTVVPDHLEIIGRWYTYLDDPRPYWPVVRILDKVEQTPVGRVREGVAWFSCLGELGVVADSEPGQGTEFVYLDRSWRSKVTLTLDSSAVPLPLTTFPWTIRVGYRSPEMYHFPVLGPAQPLVPGSLAVTAETWDPEPPMKGTIASRSFTIDVQQTDEGFVLEIPADSECVLIGVNTKVIDAAGYTWEPGDIVDVPNETVTFDDDFKDFVKQCAGKRRGWARVKEPSLLDQLWNPPDVYAKSIQEAIRTEQPAVVDEIGALIDAQGVEGLSGLLGPSTVRGRQ